MYHRMSANVIGKYTFVQVAFQFIKVLLLQTNLQVENMIARCSTSWAPSTRNWVSFLHRILGASTYRCAQNSLSSNSCREEYWAAQHDEVLQCIGCWEVDEDTQKPGLLDPMVGNQSTSFNNLQDGFRHPCWCLSEWSPAWTSMQLPKLMVP